MKNVYLLFLLAFINVLVPGKVNAQSPDIINHIQNQLYLDSLYLNCQDKNAAIFYGRLKGDVKSISYIGDNFLPFWKINFDYLSNIVRLETKSIPADLILSDKIKWYADTEQIETVSYGDSKKSNRPK